MRFLAIALLALALGACSLLDRWTAGAGAGPRPERGDLVAYLDGLRGLDEARLASEVKRQREAAARDSDDLARVKAALALSLSARGDDAEILALVEPVAGRAGAPAEARAMASFLHAMTLERRRLRESAAAAGTRLREERRAHEIEKQRAEALQERAAQLQQKLDALSELEKSLSDRQPSSR